MLYCTDIYCDDAQELKLAQRDQIVDTQWHVFTDGGRGKKISTLDFKEGGSGTVTDN